MLRAIGLARAWANRIWWLERYIPRPIDQCVYAYQMVHPEVRGRTWQRHLSYELVSKLLTESSFYMSPLSHLP